MKKSICQNSSEEIFPKNPEKYVTNLSDFNLTKVHLEALSLGFKFSVPFNKPSRIDVESQFENLNSQLSGLQPSSKDNESWFKARCVDLVNQYMATPNRHYKFLTQEHQSALKDIMSNDRIVVLRPDKGSGVAIMNKDDYLNKMYEVLSDNKRFLPDTKSKDMTHQTERSVCQLINKLLQDKVIDKTLHTSLRPRGSHLPRMYGLPKTHKNAAPLRPILAMTNSPQHKLARWLAAVIEPIRKSISRFSLKDSFDFINRLEGKNARNCFMVSFDVVSLFTNISPEETIDIVCTYSSMTDIPRSQLRELLLLCTKNVQFVFNGSFYRQVDGVAMGCPLGPVLADIFLSHIENKLDEAIKDTYLYVRYVDDTFILCKSEDHANELLELFNSIHPNIKFTMEQENCEQLHFLDPNILEIIQVPVIVLLKSDIQDDRTDKTIAILTYITIVTTQRTKLKSKSNRIEFCDCAKDLTSSFNGINR